MTSGALNSEWFNKIIPCFFLFLVQVLFELSKIVYHTERDYITEVWKGEICVWLFLIQLASGPLKLTA